MITFFFQAAMAVSISAFFSCSNPEMPAAGEKQIESVDNMINQVPQDSISKSVYDFSFRTLEGKEVKLSAYKGKKIMIVNTASECGYTPQYEQLETVYKKYKGKLVILGFPTNDFGGQEPGSNEEIGQFCTKNYGVTFPLSEKITVKGDEIPALYKWLTTEALNGKMDSEVKWNFQKYLIDEKGNLLGVYESKVKPDAPEIIKQIEK